jgi:RNA polymerase sigma-70 factor (ECF subfamily)
MTERSGSSQIPEVEAQALESSVKTSETPIPPGDPLLGPAKRPDFTTIFQTECSYMWNTLRRLGVQERDVEDVAHDVFVAVHRRLDSYDPTRPLKPWLFGIAFRVASDYRRLARHRRELMDDTFEAVDGAPPADEQLETEQARRLVLEALDALDLDKRAVFVMHELDGHAMPAIAIALGIPVNTAYSRLRLARETFATAVKRIRLRADRGRR